MEALIEETRKIAEERFKAFGFAKEQIDQLVASGERDMRAELVKLQVLLEEENPDTEKLNQSLHALKGLFLNMGNEALALKFSELREEEKNEEKIDLLKEMIQ
jgi:hypothetical protein